MIWERKLTEEAVRATAGVLSRACDLAEEARWRFDMDTVVFRERIEQNDDLVWLRSLWVLGESQHEWLLVGCRDLPYVTEARIDAGSFVLESQTLPDLMRATRGRRAFGSDVYDVAFLLATDMLLA